DAEQMGHEACSSDGPVSIFAPGMSSTLMQTVRGAVTIRQTTADDAQPLRTLRLEALSSSPTSFGSAVEDVDAHDWTKLAAGDANNAVFVAEHDGQLVGMTGMYRSTR